MPPVAPTAPEVRVIKSGDVICKSVGDAISRMALSCRARLFNKHDNNQRKQKFKMMNNHKNGCEYNCPSCVFFSCKFMGNKKHCKKLNCNGSDRYFIEIND